MDVTRRIKENAMKYAKILGKYAINTNPPDTAVIDMRPTGNIRDNPELLTKLGFYPLVKTEGPDEGDYRAVYTLTDGQVVQSWEAYTPAPAVHRYSKLKVVQALIGMDKLDTFYAALDTNARAMWDACSLLDSSDPFFQSLSGGMITALGITEAQFQGIMEGCEI